MVVEFSGSCPTTNNLYITLVTKTGRVIRVTAPEARVFKAWVKRAIKKVPQIKDFIKSIEDYWLSMIVEFYVPLYTIGKDAKSAIHRWDETNRIKAPEDAVMDALGIDDSFVKATLLEKFHNTAEPFWRMEIYARDPVSDRGLVLRTVAPKLERQQEGGETPAGSVGVSEGAGGPEAPKGAVATSGVAYSLQLADGEGEGQKEGPK